MKRHGTPGGDWTHKPRLEGPITLPIRPQGHVKRLYCIFSRVILPSLIGSYLHNFLKSLTTTTDKCAPLSFTKLFLRMLLNIVHYPWYPVPLRVCEAICFAYYSSERIFNSFLLGSYHSYPPQFTFYSGTLVGSWLPITALVIEHLYGCSGLPSSY